MVRLVAGREVADVLRGGVVRTFRLTAPRVMGLPRRTPLGTLGCGKGRKARRHCKRAKTREGCLVFVGLNGTGAPQLGGLIDALGQDETLD